jgi:predicted oxidoreductase
MNKKQTFNELTGDTALSEKGGNATFPDIPRTIFSKVIAGTMNWGVWGAKFSSQDYLTMIEKCLEYEVTSFDLADIYGHYTLEEEFGKALSGKSSIRDKIQLITKCGLKLVTPNRPEHKIQSYDTSRSHIIQSVENSLKNLATGYIDVLLIHRPDPLMDPAEIAEVFSTLRSQGKVLHFGVSNFNASQANMINAAFPIIANQIEISIIKLSCFTDGTLDHCIKENITPMAGSPLGGGKFFEEEDDRNRRIKAVSQWLAEKYSVLPEQILLAWLMKHPSRIKPVLGTAKHEQIKLAIEAATLDITREDWFMLWRASRGKEVA